MSRIECVGRHVVYENPRPHVHSRHGFHPGMVQLPSGELVALFVLAEAFEAPNGTTYVTRSMDLGRTWTLEGPLYDKSTVGFETTDTMKPALLRDGTLIATGYRFHRHDLEEGIAIAETGGFQPGDNLVSFSGDGGHNWTAPEVIPRSRPELLELSGPPVESRSGDLLATAGFYRLPDGSNPSGPFGVLLRSRDKGRTWDDRTYIVPPGPITSWETRLCEMDDGRLVVIVWVYDAASDRHLPNHVTVSSDNGRTWLPLVDIGHMAQASSVCALRGNLLLSIHAHRGVDPGIYVRLVDFAGNRWTVVDEALIWGRELGQQTGPGQSMAQMFGSLRFGQPSLLRLSNGEWLATHWSIEDGQGRIRAHRLRIEAARRR